MNPKTGDVARYVAQSSRSHVEMRIGQRISANDRDPTENGGSQKTKLPSKVPLAEKVAGSRALRRFQGARERGWVS